VARTPTVPSSNCSTCLIGSVSVVVDDAVSRQEVVLDSPELALYVPPMVWAIQYKYTADAVLLVMASDLYQADDLHPRLRSISRRATRPRRAHGLTGRAETLVRSGRWLQPVGRLAHPP